MNRIVPLLLLAAACNGPSVADTFQGVEITGYLDDSRVSVTASEILGEAPVDAWVIGTSGAAVDLDTVQVDNLTRDERSTGEVRPDGSFTVALQLALGDQLSVGGDTVETPIVVDGPAVHSALTPTHLDATRFAERVTVVAEFDSDPLFHLALAHPRSGATVEMAPETLVRHIGAITAEPGDDILFYGYLSDAPDTTAVTVISAP